MQLGQFIRTAAARPFGWLDAAWARFRRRYLRFAASRSTWAFVGASSAAGVVLAMAAGYLIGVEWTRETMRTQWRAEIDEQQRHLAEDRAAWNAELALLASKVGLFEARLTRLDVLGGHLVDLYGLDPEEFNFTEEPGIGGAGIASGYPSGGLSAPSLLNRLRARAEVHELKLSILKEVLGNSELAQGMKPLGWPVTRGWLSSGFGRRISPFTGNHERHVGVDIAGVEGTPVYAIASGVVTYARRFRNYGNTVEIDHGNNYSTRYAHNQVNLVTTGQTVKQGDVIALLGNTGRSTGPHLHFEVLKNGRQINPQKYLRRY